MHSCSLVHGSIHPPIHLPSQKSFVSWPTGIHRITCTPHDANRQVLTDLLHPPSHLQYALPTTSGTSRLHCVHTSMPNVVLSMCSTSKSLVTFSDTHLTAVARITFTMWGAVSTDVSLAHGTGACCSRRSVISMCIPFCS